MANLFTKHDPYNIHKSLGLLVLLHYLHSIVHVVMVYTVMPSLNTSRCRCRTRYTSRCRTKVAGVMGDRVHSMVVATPIIAQLSSLRFINSRSLHGTL